MGLNSGEVVLGRIGEDLHMDYTAVGHTVGLAARVEQLAAPGTVYQTKLTARIIEGVFTLRDHGTPPMRGVSVPVRVYELEGVGPLRTRLDAARRRGFSRLVGREEELAWLAAILERTMAGDGQVVGVVGDAGVGKSRVCLEFAERCRSRGLAVHEVHCPSHGAAIPLLPIRELARSCLALGAEEPEADVRGKVADRLRALDLGLDDALPLVLELLGVPDPAASPPIADARTRQGRLAELMRRFVRAESAANPVVLLVDDAHWIDSASDDVLRAVTEGVRGTRTLVLANFRPEYRASWMGGSHYHQLPLAPLSQRASQALLSHLLGGDLSVGTLFDLIGERTGGNPFFIEEVVRALATSGSLVGELGDYRLSTPVETLTIPTTVQSLLAARVDRLGAHVKDVLQTAAVIGKQFDEPLLREVVGLDDHALGAALAALQETEFIHEVEPYPRAEYAFRHPLTQEVAYHSQLAERRTRLHAAVAGAIEKPRAERLRQDARV